MFKYDIKYLEKAEYNNLVLSKQMEVGNLHIFLILDTLDQKIADLLLNKIIDFLVEGLKEKDVYNSFSDILEKINNFLKEIKKTEEEEEIEKINKTSLLIAVLDNRGNLHFSKTGKASSYLVRNLNEISEITDKKSNFDSFTFVSSGKLEKGDLVVFSNKRLLNYLAKSDLIDVWEKKNLEKANDGVINILSGEKTKSNISFLSLKYEPKEELIEENDDGFLDFLFTKSKKIIKKPKKNLTKVYKNIARENKILKNIFFVLVILIAIYILYFIVGSVINKGTSSSKINQAKKEIQEINSYIDLALKSSNSKEKSNFNLNINKAEDLTKKLVERKILKEDTDSLLEKIANVKKEFNNVKIFESTVDNLVTETNEKNIVKILENRGSIFVIGEDKIIGPIVSGKKPERNIFSEMSKNDEFIDAISVGENILLLTKDSKLIKYSRNKKFSYLKVIGQKKWEDSKAIKKFGSRIYLIGKNNQIYKHKSAGGNSYTSGEPYLTKENVLQIGEIVASGIDGGIYILKKNLTLVHYFSKGNIVESIRLNKLPNNFDLKKDSKVDIIIPEKSKFIFLYLNNKIWVFKPNTQNYKSVKDLTYIGQIEAKKFDIKSFIVKGNSEILILNDKGVYKINFGVKEKSDESLDLVLN